MAHMRHRPFTVSTGLTYEEKRETLNAVGESAILTRWILVHIATRKVPHPLIDMSGYTDTSSVQNVARITDLRDRKFHAPH